MIACDRAEDLFGRAWDDELTAAERDGLELHFAACPGCRREYDELARTLELVQALPRPHVDEGFAARVVAEAHRREAAGEGAGRRIFAFAWPGEGAFGFGRPALAIAATFVVALGVGAFLMTRPGPAPQPVIAARTTVSTPAPAPAPAADVPPAPQSVAVVTPPRDETAPTTVASRPTVRRSTSTLAATSGPTIADSLFDHSADVELVLDPVQLRRERGRGYTPASPAVRGEAASITF